MSGGARQLFDPEAPPPLGEVAARTGRLRRCRHGFDRRRAPESHRGVLSIGGLYEEVEGRAEPDLSRAIGTCGCAARSSSISDHRSGHLYLDLVDPDDDRAAGGPGPRRRAHAQGQVLAQHMGASAPRALAKEGIELAEGMVVVLRGTHRPVSGQGRGQPRPRRGRRHRPARSHGGPAGPAAADARGRRAARRATRSLRVPEVPVHVGLVASPGTEGCHDFLGQLTGSGFGFRVSHVQVPVQGPSAPAAIARAVTMLGRSDCDVIAVVRGRGAKADLAAFETEAVARAVASATKPVFTGIGHTGDETVADIVAARVLHHAHRLRSADRGLGSDGGGRTHVAEPADRLARRVPGVPGRRPRRVTRQARSRLTAAARHQLRVHRERLSGRAVRARARSAPGPARVLRGGRAHPGRPPGSLGPGHLGRQEERLRGVAKAAGRLRRGAPARTRVHA